MVTVLNRQNIHNSSVLKHGQRVAVICRHIGKEMGFSEQQLQEVELCALLHDIGKTQVSKDILAKKEALTAKEFEEIKRHPECSCNILKNCEFVENLSEAVLHHHENYDGTGYPYGLKVEDIPLYSRIIRVADVFDALCSDRPYRNKYSVNQALIIMDKNFKGKFDPAIYEIFLRVINS